MSGAAREILLFRVGARVFAAGVHDAVRVGSVREVPADELLVETALGLPFARTRGIVVASDRDALAYTVVVDQVLGVRSVEADHVHPLPAFAAACLASAVVTGFVMVDDAPTLLVDLPTLVRERPARGETATERC